MFSTASTEQEANALEARFLPAEADARGDEGGGLEHESPAARPSWLRRKWEALTGSVWAPVAFKLAGLLLGVLVLSGVGVASILSTGSGTQVPLAGMLGSDIHAAWLQSKPSPSANALTASNAPNASTLQASGAGGSPNGVASAGTAASGANPGNPTPDAVAATTSDAAASASKASANVTPDGKVILNLATLEDLRHLPGIGQKRADAILALRARLGGHFKHVNDLLRVKGIGVRGLKKILPHVVLDAPAVPAA